VLSSPLTNCFPSDDVEFTTAVDETLSLEADRATSPEELVERLEDALRVRWPDVRVQPRNALADLGQTVWYIYRDGRAVSALGEKSAVTGSA
jgi:hypothetical protein